MPDCPRINEVKKRYAEAETALKAYERITLTNLAPAINQLRYAGNHLLRASSEADDAERERHILGLLPVIRESCLESFADVG